MAHKTFCDKCGKEIKPRHLFRPNGKKYDVMLNCTFQRFGLCQKRWELCYDCSKALHAFLKRPTEELEKVEDDEFVDEMDE